MRAKHIIGMVLGTLAGGVVGYFASLGGASIAIRNATERAVDAQDATRTVMELAADDVAKARAERDEAVAALERRTAKTVKGPA